jgi:hypothetical protein
MRPPEDTMASLAPYLILVDPKNPRRSSAYHQEKNGDVRIACVDPQTLGNFIVTREQADRHSSELRAAGYLACIPVEDLAAAWPIPQPAPALATA